MARKIQQPDIETQKELKSVEENMPDYVTLRNKRYKVRWLLNFTRSRITEKILESGNDDKLSCQCAALIILNGYWAIKLKYHFLWRWFYYVKQYGEEELTDLLTLGKKKVPQEQYYTNTILLTALKDTSMTMKKTEVATILQGQNTEQPLK